MNILVVEDEPVAREILHAILAAHGGFKLTLTENGYDAWALLDDPSRVFDLVFLDIQMPEMDGLELLTRMRASPYHRNVPVVMCTSSNDRSTVIKAIQLGAQHYLVKPATQSAVYAKLRQMFPNLPAPASAPADSAAVPA